MPGPAADARTPSSATRKAFGRGAFEPMPAMRILWRIIAPLLVVHVTLALWSGYRAIWQVLSLDLRVPSATIQSGASASYSVLSSGRVPVTVRLQLIQGARADTLAVTRVRQGYPAGYDPRLFRGERTVVFTNAMLSGYRPGPAVLRATAIGSMQWLRTPPPTIRETAVRIVR